MPAPSEWRYKPRRAPWYGGRKTLLAVGLITLLTLSGLVILALVREQTGPEGFLVGLGLAVLPVPLLVTAFCWLDRVEPEPWRNLAFAFAWGACAATLVAIIANGFATQWLASTIAAASPATADTWGATVVAPFVEESAKGAAVLLLFLFRRRNFDGIVDGVVIAGITATGFAFTENVLYLGNAFGEDQHLGYSGLQSTTAATFFIRIVMSPFAHPLFTCVTGLAFGIASMAGHHQRVRRVLLPLMGLLTAMLLHGVWNGSSTLGPYGFITVYGLFMVPVFGVLTWLVIWARQSGLRSIRAHLPAYQAAGWLTPPEPVALSSMKARNLARTVTRHRHGRPAARTVSEYTSFATSLAFLRARAHRGAPDRDFTAREQELLHHLWQRKHLAAPALTHATHATAARAYAPAQQRPQQGPQQGWAPQQQTPYGYPQPGYQQTGYEQGGYAQSGYRQPHYAPPGRPPHPSPYDAPHSASYGRPPGSAP
ncbi:PrsW family intramembrane metalloprotease [Streptomyces sp. H27-D2]|uniref:PrsW family intramembrane metalloprotease n=1 Tax=Streptomyces sp. H27-D2 TaxID=3046304 RepID=UPI002DBC5C3C|nr:PrsW family intramembrane metalloprotease [Streptomyces sp. H27-D2]MEC4018119.1 PrsW family intramembrane metalloprotease [Streptomyces sp. H27-D2]